MLYSSSAHADGTSGFFFDADKNAPSDAFPVQDSDARTCINLPAGASYSFTAPAAAETYGALSTTDAPAPTAAEALANAQQVQIEHINVEAQAAENSPITFTTAAGVTATFPMSAQVKYLAAYTRYVVHSQTLPSGFAFLDESGKSIAMTVADIDSMATQVFDQVDSAVNKLGTLIAKIDAATTVSAVQAITW